MDTDSLWNVSAKRLPYYLLSYSILVSFLTITAIATAPGGFWSALFVIAERVAVSSAALAGIILMLEGAIVGSTKLIIERAKNKAWQEGVQQGVQQERERLRKAGITIPPDKQSSAKGGGESSQKS